MPSPNGPYDRSQNRRKWREFVYGDEEEHWMECSWQLGAVSDSVEWDQAATGRESMSPWHLLTYIIYVPWRCKYMFCLENEKLWKEMSQSSKTQQLGAWQLGAQIHSLHQVATGTPSRVPPRRCTRLLAISRGFIEWIHVPSCHAPSCHRDSFPHCILGIGL